MLKNFCFTNIQRKSVLPNFLVFICINMSEQEELKNDAYKGSKILYEDDNIIFLKCLSYESAKYFGPPFLWKKWESHKYGDTFIVVDKKGNEWVPTKSYVISVGEHDTYYLDEEDQQVKTSEFFRQFPQIENLVYKTIPAQTIYQILKKIQYGEEYPSHTLNRYDDLISGFRFNKNSPGKSMVQLTFDDDEDYFKLFDLHEDDIWFLGNLFSYYGYDMGFYYSDLAYEDWKEGYLLYEFNEENRRKIFEIMTYFDPKLSTMEGETNIQISKLLYDTFPRQTENIIDDYQTEKEQCITRTAKTEVTNDLTDKFINYGIFEKNTFSKYVTTVSVLLSIYKMYGDYDLTIQELMSKLGHEFSVGPYQEYMYEYGCDDFDSESFNNYVSKQLAKMLEEIEESDKFSNLDEFKKVSSEVRKNYDFDKWYPTPKDKTLKFNIRSIDPKTNKITLVTQKQFEDVKGRSLTLDEFNSFLYNLELFEGKILNLRKKR